MTEEQKKYLIDLNGMLFFKSEQDKENLEKFIKKDEALNSLGAISYLIKQNLTESQKAQARENIGAAAPGEGGGSDTVVVEDEIFIIEPETFDEDTKTGTLSQATLETAVGYAGVKPIYFHCGEMFIPYTTEGVFILCSAEFSVVVNLYLDTLSFALEYIETIANKFDDDGLLKIQYLPNLGFYDDVIEGYLNPEDNLFYKNYRYDLEGMGVGNLYSHPITGESGKIYLDLHTNNTYRWSGSQYVRINPDEYTIATNEQILALFN